MNWYRKAVEEEEEDLLGSALLDAGVLKTPEVKAPEPELKDGGRARLLKSRNLKGGITVAKGTEAVITSSGVPGRWLFHFRPENNVCVIVYAEDLEPVT